MLIPLTLVMGFGGGSLTLAQMPAIPAKPTTHLRDNAGILSHECEAELIPFLQQVQRQSGVELVVVTIDRIPQSKASGFSTARKKSVTIETYAKAMFNHYEIGNVPANQGVLLLVAKQDRKCRIELGAGYATSTDHIAKQIIDRSIIPAFGSGEYERGIREGVNEIAVSIAGMDLGHPASRSFSWVLIPLCFFGLIGTLIFGSLAINGKRGWGWVVVGMVYIQYLQLRNWTREPWPNAGRSTYGTSSGSGFGIFDGGSSWGGDSFSSGGGGGGFSDGGGASGDW